MTDANRARDAQLKACNLFGLNPEQVTSLQVEFDPHTRGAAAVVRWEGVKRLTPDELQTFLIAMRDTGASDGAL